MKLQPTIPIEIVPPLDSPPDATPVPHPPRESEATAPAREVGTREPGPSPAHSRLLETYRLWSESGR